jgi:hypothetical protein
MHYLIRVMPACCSAWGPGLISSICFLCINHRIARFCPPLPAQCRFDHRLKIYYPGPHGLRSRSMEEVIYEWFRLGSCAHSEWTLETPVRYVIFSNVRIAHYKSFSVLGQDSIYNVHVVAQRDVQDPSEERQTGYQSR